MNRILVVPLLASLTSCVVHLHVHEAPEKPAKVKQAAASDDSTANATVHGSVAGIIVDQAGRPVRGRVAAVGPSGSFSTSTGEDGRFALHDLFWPELVLHASTEDGLLAVRAHVVPGADGLELVVRPASGVTIDFEGMKNVRCAIFHAGDRIEDFTLHPATPARVVVPAGEVVVQLYDGDGVRAEQTVEQEVGGRAELSFGSL